MNNEKVRRCKVCGKLLVIEKLPICKKCFLKGREELLKDGAYAGIAITATAVLNYLSNKNNNR